MIIKRSKAMECGGMKKGKKYGPFGADFTIIVEPYEEFGRECTESDVQVSHA